MQITREVKCSQNIESFPKYKINAKNEKHPQHKLPNLNKNTMMKSMK